VFFFVFSTNLGKICFVKVLFERNTTHGHTCNVKNCSQTILTIQFGKQNLMMKRDKSCKNVCCYLWSFKNGSMELKKVRLGDKSNFKDFLLSHWMSNGDVFMMFISLTNFWTRFNCLTFICFSMVRMPLGLK
jgi:hypothetical protein